MVDVTLSRDRDVLKRHWRTCKACLNSGQSHPYDSSVSGRGRKRKACDRCVRLKKACNFSFPCDTCQARQVACSYHKLDDVSAPLPAVGGSLDNASDNKHTQEMENPDFGESSTAASSLHRLNQEGTLGSEVGSIPTMTSPFDFDWIDWGLCSSLLHTPQNHLPGPVHASLGQPSALEFLSQFTSTHGFVNSFDCGTHWQRWQIAMDPGPAGHGNPDIPSGLGLGLWEEELHHSELLGVNWVSGTGDTTRHCNPLQTPANAGDAIGPDSPADDSLPTRATVSAHGISETPHHGASLLDTLAIRAHLIVQGLREVASKTTQNSYTTLRWSTFLEGKCLQLFSPSKIRRFLSLFWSSWYPNCPIVHKPTFTAEQASPVLLATMVVIGACVSPLESDNEDVRPWFDYVEEMVFSDEWLQDDLVPGPSSSRCESQLARQKRLQSLQAAYFVCLFQNWEGSEGAKRRIRRHRYSTVISVSSAYYTCPHWTLTN